jgi:hypothetical protein
LILSPVRPSQETHYISATKPNRLLLFRETVAVYCENRTEHTDTLCGQNAEFWYGTYSNRWDLMGQSVARDGPCAQRRASEGV